MEKENTELVTKNYKRDGCCIILDISRHMARSEVVKIKDANCCQVYSYANF